MQIIRFHFFPSASRHASFSLQARIFQPRRDSSDNHLSMNDEAKVPTCTPGKHAEYKDKYSVIARMDYGGDIKPRMSLKTDRIYVTHTQYVLEKISKSQRKKRAFGCLARIQFTSQSGDRPSYKNQPVRYIIMWYCGTLKGTRRDVDRQNQHGRLGLTQCLSALLPQEHQYNAQIHVSTVCSSMLRSSNTM